MSKTLRKPYTKSKRFDKTCRNHGSCAYCKSNRMYSTKKRLVAAVID
jgi:5-methylcytosine-specific restriction endonuclease McrA